jgi:hypothetical protein
MRPIRASFARRNALHTIFFLRTKVNPVHLVDTIMQAAGGARLAKLPGVLGAEEDKTKSVVAAAVPALLAEIGSIFSKPDGAKKPWSAVHGVDDSTVAATSINYGEAINLTCWRTWARANWNLDSASAHLLG